MPSTPVDNRVPCCSAPRRNSGTRPPVPPVPHCSKTPRNRHLTCANASQTPVFRSHLVPHPQNRTTPKHVSAGQSVIHSLSYSPVTTCSTTPWNTLTCGNVLVPLTPTNEFPCGTSVPPPSPYGGVRSQPHHAHPAGRSGPRQTPEQRPNSNHHQKPGATR